MNIKSLVLLTFLGVASLLGLAILIGVFSGRPDAQFSEGRMVTFISGAQFLWAAWLLNRIRQLRHVAPNRSFWKPATAIWGMMALGFIFLAADDMLGVHEKLDKLCHSLFKLKETPITDRLDDLIIGAYALAGLVVMFVYRAELIRHKETLPYLVWGGSIGFLMIAIDVLTNQDHLLERFVVRERVKSLSVWLAVAEDSLKVLAGTCFLLGCHDVLRTARNERG